MPEDNRRLELQKWLDETLRPWFDQRVLPVTQAIAERMGRLAGEHDNKGLTIAVADALIAATALEWGLVSATRNVKDFVGLDLPLFNPWDGSMRD